MRHPPIQPFDHPAAWKASDFASKDALSIDLERRHLDALEAELARLKGRVEDFGQVSPQTFPLRAIADDVANWRRQVWHGRGILIMRGFPVERLAPEDLRAMYLGLGSHFGRPVSQSALGDLIGEAR